ncbi:hypothetical protein ACHQM5_013099 [Ranunculus cassubicifolius]
MLDPSVLKTQFINCNRYIVSSSSSSSNSSMGRSISRSSSSFSRKCLSIAKQQKTRFYILGRCISILLCWQSHSVRD